jgi:hypothetical protein
MEMHWKVNDGNRGFNKAKLMLESLEAFSDMRVSGHLGPFDELNEADQDLFLQYVESAVQFAQRCAHSHPDAVAVIIRAAEICDEMRCPEKRDEVIEVAERTARTMDKRLSYMRPSESSVPLLKKPMNEVEFEFKLKVNDDVRQKYPGVNFDQESPEYFEYYLMKMHKIPFVELSEPEKRNILAKPHDE